MALRLLLLIWTLGLAVATSAWADPTTVPHIVEPGSPEGRPIVQAAEAALRADLGKPATLHVKRLSAVEDWAFVYASMNGANGEPIDYTGTPYAEAAANHAKSRTYAGLLRRSENAWAVTAQAVGPTDVAWEGWPQRYGVPPALVEVPVD